MKLITLLLSLFLTNSTVKASEKYGPRLPDPVLRVIDGDTVYIKVQLNYGNLMCIDAPETGQDPWGVISTKRLTELVSNESSLLIKVMSTDNDNKSLVVLKGANGTLQKQLVEEGLAYLVGTKETCPLYEELIEAEDKAKGKGIGVWSNPQFIKPWEYRNNVRSYY